MPIYGITGSATFSSTIPGLTVSQLSSYPSYIDGMMSYIADNSNGSITARDLRDVSLTQWYYAMSIAISELNPGGASGSIQYNSNGVLGGTIFNTDGTNLIMPSGTFIKSGTNKPYVDIFHGELITHTGHIVADWDSETLYDVNGNSSIWWNLRQLLDSLGNPSVDYDNRFFYYSSNIISIDYGDGYIYDSSGVFSIDYGSRILTDSSGQISIKYSDRILLDNSAINSIDYQHRLNYDTSGIPSIDWGSGSSTDRQTFDSSSMLAIDWGNRLLYDTNGNLVMDFGSGFVPPNRLLYDSTGNLVSIDFNQRTLYNYSPGLTLTGTGTLPIISIGRTFSLVGSGASVTVTNIISEHYYGPSRVISIGITVNSGTPTVGDTYGNWNVDTYYKVYGVAIDYGNGVLNDVYNATTSLDWNNRITYDSTSQPSINWAQRLLEDNTGVTILNWNNTQLIINAVDNWGAVQVIGRNAGEASIALMPSNVTNGSAGQWIISTNGSNMTNTADFAIYNSPTGIAFYIQQSTNNIGIGTNNPNSVAILDLETTTKGFLPPRMTTTQRHGISPVAGLIVYDTTLNVLTLYNGTQWDSFTMSGPV